MKNSDNGDPFYWGSNILENDHALALSGKLVEICLERLYSSDVKNEEIRVICHLMRSLRFPGDAEEHAFLKLQAISRDEKWLQEMEALPYNRGSFVRTAIYWELMQMSEYLNR